MAVGPLLPLFPTRVRCRGNAGVFLASNSLFAINSHNENKTQINDVLSQLSERKLLFQALASTAALFFFTAPRLVSVRDGLR